MNKIIKLVFLCFQYVVFLFSFLFPRKKNRWIFGAGNNFTDNTKYLYLDIISNHKDIDAIWITKNKELVKFLQSKMLPVEYKYSFKGIKYLFTANVYCVSNYLNLLKNEFTLPLCTIGRAKYVQLWHGVGIKNVLFARNDDLTASKLKHPFLKWFWTPFHLNVLIKPSLFLSTSKNMTEHFIKCFRLNPKNIIISNYPRCEVFEINKNKEYFKNFANTDEINTKNTFEKYNQILIYMPTFRDGNRNYLTESGINFNILNEVMIKEKSLFLFKLHPWSKVDFDITASNFSNLLFLESSIDIYPILPMIDILITDYSSIYYDFLLLPDKHTIFFDFDREIYLDERDLAFDYDEYTNGVKVKTFNELIKTLQTKNYKNTDRFKDIKLRDFFWEESENKDNLIQEIKKLETL